MGGEMSMWPALTSLEMTAGFAVTGAGQTGVLPGFWLLLCRPVYRVDGGRKWGVQLQRGWLEPEGGRGTRLVSRLTGSEHWPTWG